MTPARKQPDQPWWLLFIEKHGISTFILLAGGYYVTQTVVNPLVETAQTFVSDIHESNVILKDEIMTANKQTLDRWNQIFVLMDRKRSRIDIVIAKLEEIKASQDKLHNEIEVFRALLTRPESVEIRGMPKLEEK